MTKLATELLDKVHVAETFFLNSSTHSAIASEGVGAFHAGRFAEADQALSKLPTEDELLESQIEMLKEKPVYKTLKKISTNETLSIAEELKGWYSLGTQVCISVEHGKQEYGMLLFRIYERIGKLLYQL